VKFNRRYCTALLLMVLGASVLAGCSKPAEPEATPAEPADPAAAARTGLTTAPTTQSNESPMKGRIAPPSN
jgi:outer membrane PBP1 activator LpoA protein